MSSSLVKTVLVSRFGKTRAQRGFRAGVAFHLFVQVNGKRVIARNAVLSDASADGESSFCRALPNNELPCTDDFG